MTKQMVHFIELPELYKILLELKDILSFDVNNYQSRKELSNALIDNKIDFSNSIIVAKSHENLLIDNDKLDKKNILFIDKFPVHLNKLIDKINVHLIQHQYNFKSNLNIKNYILNINSRTVFKDNKELKLTEKEIDIILFLSKINKPQKINVLQSQIWKYSADLETHTVETHVYRLRKKIKDKFNDENFIISSEKGYSI
tara:strand:+ start:14 stop:610 length:597 start_codon:yes stop_codon:yes gene_type:complete